MTNVYMYFFCETVTKYVFETTVHIIVFIVDVLTSKFIAVTDFTHGRILQIELQTGNVVKLPLSIIRPKGLAFDKRTMTLFYSDALTKTIALTTLHGKNKTLIYELG